VGKIERGGEEGGKEQRQREGVGRGSRRSRRRKSLGLRYQGSR